MKKLLIFMSVLLILSLMPVALFGCNNDAEPTEAPTELPSESSSESASESNTQNDADKETVNDATVVKARTVSLKGDLSKIKTHGRTYSLSTGLACDFVGSGIEFCGVMKGKVTVRIKVEKKSRSTPAYFTVYIDGVRQEKRYSVACGTTALLEVANFQSEGKHTIKIVKQSEATHDIAELIDIRFTGYLTERPANREYYIEVIGDSLTCGLGNLADNSVTSATTEHSDGTQSYGYLLAEKLGADCNIISESGLALSVGTNGYNGHQASDLYEKASVFRDANKAQVQSERIPDLIVINLGVNDYYFNGTYPTWCTIPEVKSETAAFINQVRQSYGEAGEDIPIVWVSEFLPMSYNERGKSYKDAIRGIIDDMGGEAAGLYYMDVTPNTKGGQAHPDLAGHKLACNEIYDYVVVQKEIIQ